MGKLTVGLGVPRGNPAIFNAVAHIVKQLPYDYEVISWNRPGSTVAGSGNTSLHASGDALDIRPKGAKMIPGSPCGGSVLDPESRRRNTILYTALGSEFQEKLWLTCTGGNHHDHVHVGDPSPPDAPQGLIGSTFKGKVIDPADKLLSGIMNQIVPFGVGILIVILGVVAIVLMIAFKAYTGGLT